MLRKSQSQASILQIGRPVIRLLFPWLVFWALFAWGWQVRNPFTDIPACYESPDAFEVLWGIRWYHEALFSRHLTPFFTNLAFHPIGWHTTTLAHTPTLFVIAQPLYMVGGEVFTYNIFVVTALVVAFAGTVRFMRLFTRDAAALVAALAFTFAGARWFRVNEGHLPILWLSGLLPWLAWMLEQARTAPECRKWPLLAGLLWGAMIHWTLYGIFLGAALFAVWGRFIFRPEGIRRGLWIAIIALIIGLPVIGLYAWGQAQDQTRFFSAEDDVMWSASLNSLSVPSVFHPLPPVRRIARSVYTGPYNESGIINLGPVMSLLALFGLVVALRARPRAAGPVWLTGMGLVLGLGLWLRWNGDVLQFPPLRPLNVAIWRLGHALKPEIFPSPDPPPFLETGVPLPGLLLIAIVPSAEGARTFARYGLIGILGAATLAGMALPRLPRLLRYLLITLWLVEILPPSTGSFPVPYGEHPAYAWLAEQDMGPEGIVDIIYPTVMLSGAVVWASELHHHPTAAGTGSSWPRHFAALWDYFWNDEAALSRLRTGLVLQQYRVRYLFLHLRGPREEAMWKMVRNNPAFRPLRCFDPLPGPTLWPYPICIAEVLPTQRPIQVAPIKGWSDLEEWGMWSEGTRAEAGWIASERRDYALHIGAFPFCVPDQHQRMSVFVNGKKIAEHLWEDCEHWEGTIPIPATIIRAGWNTFTFEYAYAIRPYELTRGEQVDHRALAVGFTALEIR